MIIYEYRSLKRECVLKLSCRVIRLISLGDFQPWKQSKWYEFNSKFTSNARAKFPRQKNIPFIRIKASPSIRSPSVESRISGDQTVSVPSAMVLTAHNVQLAQYLESSWQVLLYNYCVTLTRACWRRSELVAGGTRLNGGGLIRGARS